MSFEFWYRWLLTVSIFFALVGLYIAFLPEGWVLTPWNEAAEREFFEGNPTVEATAFKSFLFGPLGATIAGFYVLQVFVVWNAFGRKERWAWWAIAAGTLVWFAVDSLRSIQHGAWFNLILINLPCLLIVGLPLVMTYRYFLPRANGPVPFSGVGRIDDVKEDGSL